jgi:hypothetical protein
MTRTSVDKWIDRALALGVQIGLRHAPDEPRQRSPLMQKREWFI